MEQVTIVITADTLMEHSNQFKSIAEADAWLKEQKEPLRDALMEHLSDELKYLDTDY